MGVEATARSKLRTRGADNAPQWMTRNTHVNSGYERLFKGQLLKALPHNDVSYEPVRLPLIEHGLVKDAYTPDFILPTLYVNGKVVAIEPHGAPFLSARYLEKLAAAKDIYNLYLVLASDVERVGIEKKFGLLVGDFIDQYWYVSNPKFSKGQPKSKSEAVLRLRIHDLLNVAERGEDYLKYLKSAARFYSAMAQKDKADFVDLMRPMAA
ncbi:MAG: hypothetical protein KGI00_02850 [Candidatus Micrarchaeota archaeon]|nr:hypothetical protein [Candidatus Micrarchaeota archaeon]